MADVDIRTWPPARLVEIVSVGLGEPPEIPVACVPILVSRHRGPIDQLKSLTAPERELLCTTTMRFLTTLRTSEQLLRLCTEMNSDACCCVQGPEILQNVPHPSEDDEDDCAMLEDLLVWMPIFLITAIGDRRQLYPRRIKHRRNWPRSSEDFLSDNPAASLHMLGVWVHVQMSKPKQAAMMITFTDIIFDCIRTHALSAFLQSPMLWCWIHAVIEDYKPIMTAAFYTLHEGDTSPTYFIATAKFVQLLEMEIFDEELEISVANHPSLTVDEIIIALCKGSRALEDFRENEESTANTERMRHDWNHLLARLVMHIPAARPTDLPDSIYQVISVLDSCWPPLSWCFWRSMDPSLLWTVLPRHAHLSGSQVQDLCSVPTRNLLFPIVPEVCLEISWRSPPGRMRYLPCLCECSEHSTTQACQLAVGLTGLNGDDGGHGSLCVS
jgi:hypothetical protein